MAFFERTPSPVKGHKSPFFKVPPVPRKCIDSTSRPPLSKLQATTTATLGSELAAASPCVQLGQKRPTFPFSPAYATPKSGTNSTSHFFCEDDWQAWKENIEKVAIETCVGPRPPTPPVWVATPHRSSLLMGRRSGINECKSRIRRRLMSIESTQKEKSDGKTIVGTMENGRNEEGSDTTEMMDTQ